MTPFEYNFEVPQFNYEWDNYNASTYSHLLPWFEEFVYNESCHICFSHSHFVTECYHAHEFLQFVQKYVYATQGCMNPSSDNSYSYTHNNEWKTYANSSQTQEPWWMTLILLIFLPIIQSLLNNPTNMTILRYLKKIQILRIVCCK